MDVLAVALITFFLGVLYLLFYNGLAVKVTFEEEEVRPMALAYKLAIGDYAKSSKGMEEIYRTLIAQGVQDLTGFGIYFDNPDTTPSGELRSLVGCIVKDEKDLGKIHNTKHATLPAASHFVAAFPYKGKFSIAMGALKIYSALAKYRNIHGTPEAPVMEIYDRDNGRIIYVVLTGLSRERLEDLVKAE